MKLTYEEAKAKQRRLALKGLFVHVRPNGDGTYYVEQPSKLRKPGAHLRLVKLP